MIYFDVTDLINHSKFSTKVSGIQRVVLESMRGIQNKSIIFFISPITGRQYKINGLSKCNLNDLSCFMNLWIFADIFFSAGEKENVKCYLTRCLNRSRKWKVAVTTTLIALKIPVFDKILLSIIKKIINRRIHIDTNIEITEIETFEKGIPVAFFGGIWNFQNIYEDLFIEKLSNHKKFFMVYDMIPIVSEFVPNELKTMFESYIPFVIKNSDTIIVNSMSCKSDLQQYIQLNHLNNPNIEVIHLSHVMPKHSAEEHNNQIPLRTRKLFKEKFILCVGSIESRKNHINLLIMWQKFFNSPEYANEKLVIVGKWLWDTEEIARLLTYTGHICGSVIIIEGASDQEVNSLYEHCRFTVYPSHYEGWGLPVGESLSLGKPCIHFDISSLTEAGYGLSTPIPYLDYKKFYSTLVEYIKNDETYNLATSNINKQMNRLRTWSDFNSDIKNVLTPEC